MTLSPTEIYRDRNIFLIGSTGFLGKVTLSMLLHRFPNIGKIYITVRARSQEESEARFWNNIITAPPFDPLRERYGSALEGFIRDKVVVRGGDIAETNFGYTEEEAQSIADDVDVILNSAGNVTFNPTLESALRTNVVGTQNVIAFATNEAPRAGARVYMFCGRQSIGRGVGERSGTWLFSTKKRVAWRSILSGPGDC